MPISQTATRRTVSFQWKNPDSPLKNADFLLKNGWFYS